MRPGCRPTGAQIEMILKRVVAYLRQAWPEVQLFLRADSHFSVPEVHDFCDQHEVHFVLGQASNSRLKEQVAPWLAQVPLGKADASAAAGVNFPANLGECIFAFLHNDRLLDLIESIIGPEIYANSCQHIRPKLPATGDYEGGLSMSEWARSTAWHQDLGVLLPEADDTLVITSWIPLVDAD